MILRWNNKQNLDKTIVRGSVTNDKYVYIMVGQHEYIEQNSLGIPVKIGISKNPFLRRYQVERNLKPKNVDPEEYGVERLSIKNPIIFGVSSLYPYAESIEKLSQEYLCENSEEGIPSPHKKIKGYNDWFLTSNLSDVVFSIVTAISEIETDIKAKFGNFDSASTCYFIGSKQYEEGHHFKAFMEKESNYLNGVMRLMTEYYAIKKEKSDIFDEQYKKSS